MKSPARIAIIAVLSVSTQFAGPATGPAAAQLSQNLLQNPGAEAGPGANDTGVQVPPGWQTTSNFTAGAYAGFDQGPPAVGGSNFFAGGPANSESTATQDVDVSQHAQKIDEGAVNAVLSAYIGGWLDQADSGTVSASFLSYVDTVIGGVTIGPVTLADRAGQSKLLPRTDSAYVPPGTRKIRVVMRATRSAGIYNDGYFDNLELKLEGVAPPPKCFGKTATIVGTAVLGTPIFGTPKADVIVGTPFPDVILGGGGRDRICSLGGDDHVNGGGGVDRISGGAQDDALVGGVGEFDDVIEGGAGDDRIQGGGGKDILEGDAGNDTIFGGDANDLIYGVPGRDELYGRSGDDSLYGGKGRDNANGGLGLDLCDEVEEDRRSCELGGP